MELPYQVPVFLPSMIFPSHGIKKEKGREEEEKGSPLEMLCVCKALKLHYCKARVVQECGSAL